MKFAFITKRKSIVCRTSEDNFISFSSSCSVAAVRFAPEIPLDLAVRVEGGEVSHLGDEVEPEQVQDEQDGQE